MGHECEFFKIGQTTDFDLWLSGLVCHGHRTKWVNSKSKFEPNHSLLNTREVLRIARTRCGLHKKVLARFKVMKKCSVIE